MENNIIQNNQHEFESRLKKCGAITCIHNIDGYCNMEKCEIYERTLRQEH
ncbi:hypothetical protein [Clostridiisalibacter paucivorans]|nr:hypothetical protein [Clostridiisalibacter paucivorans]